MSATGRAPSRSTNRRTVPVETSPPSIQPLNARTSVAWSRVGQSWTVRASAFPPVMATFYGVARAGGNRPLLPVQQPDGVAGIAAVPGPFVEGPQMNPTRDVVPAAILHAFAVAVENQGRVVGRPTDRPH